MHFKITDSNVRIDLAADETEAIVAAALAVLVPRVAKKLYFLRKHDRDYPRLARLCQSRKDFHVIDTDQADRMYLKRFRIVENDGCLYIAPNTTGNLDRDLWSSLCESIKDKSATPQKPNQITGANHGQR